MNTLQWCLANIQNNRHKSGGKDFRPFAWRLATVHIYYFVHTSLCYSEAVHKFQYDYIPYCQPDRGIYLLAMVWIYLYFARACFEISHDETKNSIEWKRQLVGRGFFTAVKRVTYTKTNPVIFLVIEHLTKHMAGDDEEPLNSTKYSTEPISVTNKIVKPSQLPVAATKSSQPQKSQLHQQNL